MASTRIFSKQPSICRMPICNWNGHFTDIEEHFEISHPNYIRPIQSKSYFKLTFEDLRMKFPLLLTTDSGIYWFSQNYDNISKQGNIARGIFAIGPSEPVEYHIKLGSFTSKIVQMLGPFKSQDDNSKQFDFIMEPHYMKTLSKSISPNVVIFFGEFEDDADEIALCSSGKGKILADDIPPNFNFPKSFVCGACETVVFGAPFFCRNYHYLCEECYEIVISSDCPKCDVMCGCIFIPRNRYEGIANELGVISEAA